MLGGELKDIPLLDNDEEDPVLLGDTSTSLLQLRVKSFKDVEIAIPSNSNVAHLKELVHQALGPQCHDRYLRLICKGKLLHPEQSLLSEFKVHNNDVVHAVLAAQGVRPPTERLVSSSSSTNNPSSSSTSDDPQRRRRGGTVVGPGGRVTRVANRAGAAGLGLGSGEDSSSSDEDDLEQGAASRRGFDRLRSAGLSRAEVTALRTYFNRHVDRHVQMHPQDHQDESDLTQRRLMFEEDWMSLQSPMSEFRLNLNQNTLMRFASRERTNWRPSLGTDRDFMWGFLLGFFVGFVMLVWVWMPTVPHKQKLGILTGISFSLAADVIRQEDDDELVEGD